MNFQQWLSAAVNILSNRRNARRDAEILLEFVTGKNRTFLFAFSETLITKKQKINLDILLNRLRIGEPIAYLIGEWEFWSLPLYVSSSTLIPRSDTECLVEQALIRLNNQSQYILDLGTGTGAIALALASERPDCYVIAIDLLPKVVMLADNNIQRLKVKNVTVLQSNWFNVLSNQKFDMIVSNPPYIDIGDPYLLQGDVRFEPMTALVSSDKGMKDLNYIILHASNYLVSGGWLLVEHGWKQGKSVRSLFIQAGYQLIETCYDYNGRERLTLGKK